LVGLLFKGAGSDPELGARLIHGLIGGDRNFVFDEGAPDVVAPPESRPAYPARWGTLRRSLSRNRRRACRGRIDYRDRHVLDGQPARDEQSKSIGFQTDRDICMAQGMWMGGLVPIGYDVIERRLVVN
jgi:hypothetical protein